MELAANDWILPALAHVETNLDGDLRLETLAAAVGLSPSHFSRAFGALTGEPPSAHVARLRLERAAVMLLVRRATVLDIALDCGYASHETFSRAFARRYGMPPREWRIVGATALRARAGVEERLEAGRLSRTVVHDLRPLRMVFVRNLGPYDSVPAGLWADAVARASRARIAHRGLLLGVAHDAPELTDPARCRFDAGLVVVDAVKPPHGLGYQELPEMTVAMTTYVGPYAGIPQAYSEIVDRLLRMPNVEIVGLPTIEFYRATQITPESPMNQTDIAIPVIRRPT